MPDLSDGADAILGERVDYTKFNDVKNSYPGVAFPTNPTTGTKCMRTDLNQLFVYNGTFWQPAAGSGIEIKTDNYSIVLASDAGKTIMMNNAASKTFSLPQIDSSSVGFGLFLGSIGAGPVVIDAAAADYIRAHFGSSSAGGTAMNSLNQYFKIYIEVIQDTLWLLTTLGCDGFVLA